MVCTYEEYLKRPKAITFAKMQTIHTEMIAEIGTDVDALELLLDYLRKLPTSVLLKELTGLTYYSLRMWNNAIAYFEAVKETHLYCSDAML